LSEEITSKVAGGSANLQAQLLEKAEEFLNLVNQSLPKGMELEFEGFYRRGFFVTKKRYALIEDENIVKMIVKKVCDNFSLPYFTITPTFSVCSTHGYMSGEYKACPECNGEVEVYSRIVGYLRPLKQWNVGKQAEFRLRKNFKI